MFSSVFLFMITNIYKLFLFNICIILLNKIWDQIKNLRFQIREVTNRNTISNTIFINFRFYKPMKRHITQTAFRKSAVQ